MNEQAVVNAAYEAAETAYRQALITNKCDELMAIAEQASEQYAPNAQEAWSTYEAAVAAARKTGDEAYDAIAQGRF